MAEFGYHNNSTASSNSFELYLFDYNDSATVCGDNDDDGCTDAERANVNKPDNYGFLYRELDIKNHDVLIGEQKNTTNYTQYLFYDDNVDLSLIHI